MAIMGQGLVLMVAGMGIVYIFLWVLIVVAKAASKFVCRFDYLIPDEEPRRVWRKTGGSSAPSRKTESAACKSNAPDGTPVKAPVPGTVLRHSVTNGQTVAKDDELLVMDVMKMETPIQAPCAGVVTLLAGATDKVATGDVLAIIG